MKKASNSAKVQKTWLSPIIPWSDKIKTNNSCRKLPYDEHSTQGTHISDAEAARQVQFVHSAQGTHISDTGAATQVQSVNSAQGTHISNAGAV